jgi:tripartite-type tricarboxylate transporter receptor subunit TctC
LGEAVLKAAAMPDIQAKLRQLGYESTSVPGEQFQRDVAQEFKMWSDIIANANPKQ